MPDLKSLYSSLQLPTSGTALYDLANDVVMFEDDPTDTEYPASEFSPTGDAYKIMHRKTGKVYDLFYFD
jgi:hypothetical protein